MRKFEVIKEHNGNDNNWSQPKLVELKVGDILTAVDKYATERGDFFCKINDTNRVVSSYKLKTRCPHDPNGIADPEFLRELT